MALNPRRRGASSWEKSSPLPKAKALQERGGWRYHPGPRNSPVILLPLHHSLPRESSLKLQLGGSTVSTPAGVWASAERRARTGGRSRVAASPPISSTSRARRAVSPASREPPSTLANCGNSQVETRAHPRHSRVTEAPERRDPGTRRSPPPGAGGLGHPRREPPSRRQGQRAAPQPAPPGTRAGRGRRGRRLGELEALRKPGGRRGPAEREAGMGRGRESRDPEAGRDRRGGTGGRAGGGGYKPHALKRRAQVRPRSLTSPVHAAAHGCCRCDSDAEGYRAT